MKHRTFAALAALALLTTAPAAHAFQGVSMMSPPDPQEIRKPAEMDENFLKMAAQSDMAEIDKAMLALEKSTNSEVKAYAEHMIADHKRAAVKNMMKAQKYRVILPMSLTPEQQAMHDQLAKLSGAAFDKAYIDANVKAHEKAVQLFRDEAAFGLDPDFRHMAATLLPKLHMHWEHAVMMQKKMNGGTSGAPTSAPTGGKKK